MQRMCRRRACASARRGGPVVAAKRRERNRSIMSLPKNALVLAIALAFPAAAAAGPGTGETKTEKPVKQQKQRLSEGDLSTLQHHHDVNLMEIEMGKIAQQRGGPEVKKYAAALVKDHQTADKTAIGLAKARGVTLSSGATPMSDAEMA